MIRFKMDPRDDLSNRADFTYDLMQAMSKRAQDTVDSSKELSELKAKAKVTVQVKGSLRSIDVEIKISPLGEVKIPEAELAAANSAVAAQVNDAIRSSMSSMLQESMSSSTKRM
jgi:citrate lyase gamma subunit